MSKELVHKADFSAQLDEFNKIQDTCKNLLQTRHYQTLGEAGIHAIMARAKALGIHPFEALNGGFYVVSGRVGMSTEMMAALVRQRGHSIQKDPKSNDECVILHGKRADNGDTWTCKFDKNDAIAAGLWGGTTWKKYPATMIYNRCMSMLFRQLFPDLSLGAGYVEDELIEIAKSNEHKSNEVIEIKAEDAKLISVKRSKQKIDTIQAIEITSILNECSEEYQNDVKSFMKKELKVDLIEDLPCEFYERVKTAAVKKRDEYCIQLEEEFKEKQSRESGEAVNE